MSTLQVSIVPTNPQAAKSGGAVVRRTAEYPPSIWGDYFLSYASNSTEIDDQTKQQYEQLKEEARKMLVDSLSEEARKMLVDSLSQKLYLIDTVQRLGMSYHFETEIDEALEQIYETDHEDSSWSLCTVSLKFRLLRQQGYNVPCDVFNKFKDSKGEFKESLANDVQGMLELYEATSLRVHGEDILEEALAFTTTMLQSSLTSQLSPFLAEQVTHALNRPLRKSLPRLEARHYISIYQQTPSHNRELLNFAKLDFNILQKLHQKELGELTRWWRDLDVKRRQPYARDRVVECYLWILGVYYEPCYVLGRRILTKVMALSSIIDDTYDNYGTLEELVLFTEAIERWEIGAMGQLPEYMRHLYTTILDVYREIEDEMECQGKGRLIDYAKRSLITLAKAYLREAKWCDEQYTPTMEEYMSVALVTTGYSMLVTTSFLGMGEFATKEAFEWILSDPKIVKASSIVCRLMDDIVSSKFEQKRGHVSSAIECYVNEHGVSEEEAIEELRKQVSDAWKDTNYECLKPTRVAMPLVTRTLNFTRVVDVFYKDDDGYSNAHIVLKDFVASLLVDHVPICPQDLM